MFNLIFEGLKVYLNNDKAVWFFLLVWIPIFIYWLLCLVCVLLMYKK